MASIEIPIIPVSDDFSVTVDLDGETYQLRFCKNLRDLAWMLDIRDGDGTDLLNGRAVRVDTPLNGIAPRGNLPPGYLIALDTSGQHEEIGDYDELGERVKLMYVPEADI